MDRLRKINEEQRRQMERHKRLESEKAGYDLGETSLFGWIEKNAESFRKWAETVPYECVGCGGCTGVQPGNECPYLFDEDRVKRIDKNP